MRIAKETGRDRYTVKKSLNKYGSTQIDRKK